MRTVLFLLFLAFFVRPAIAAECGHRLDGTWTSDAAQSLDYLRKYARVPPATESFLQAILGKMTLTFAHGQLKTSMPDTVVSVQGKPRPFSGFQTKKPYRIIFCGTDTIAVATPPVYSTREELSVFNFVGPDTVWIYMGSTDPKIPDLNSREYFKRSR